MPDINLFTGGINRLKDKRKLEANECISLVDGEIISGSVVSLAKPVFTKAEISPVFISYKDEIVSGSGQYLKFTKALNYLFRCNGEKPQYTVGAKDSNSDIIWNELGIDPVETNLLVAPLVSSIQFTELNDRGTSEIATYYYAIVVDEGLESERVFRIVKDCPIAGRQITVLASTIPWPHQTVTPYRKYGNEYYKLEDGGTNSDVVDFVLTTNSLNTILPEITDCKFTYLSPIAPAVPASSTWYGTLFRTDGDGIGRLWVIGSESIEHKGTYEWSDTTVGHYWPGEFNFITGSGPEVGVEIVFNGLSNNLSFMLIKFIGKERVNNYYEFTFDVYHIYGAVAYKQFMYRMKLGSYYMNVSALENLAADQANTAIPRKFRKSAATTYKDSTYQEFFYSANEGSEGVRSDSASLKKDQPLKTGLRGNFQYAVTYADDLGQETAPGEYSRAVSAEACSLTVTIPLPADLPEGITKVRLYRMDTSLYGGQSTFLFVKEFDVADLPEVYVDNAQVSDLGGVMPSATLTSVPDDLLFITSYNGRVFGATKDYETPAGTPNDYLEYLTVRWSDVGRPLAWQGNSWLNMDSPITGIGTSSNGLLLFGLTETFALLGTESEPFTRRLISSSQGCVDFRSIQNWQGNCIFASVDGICISDGGSVQLLSYSKLGLLKTLSVDSSSYKSVESSEISSSAVVGQTYFLLFKNRFILKVDLVTGVFTEMSADFLGLGLYNGRLYGVDAASNMNLIPYQTTGDKTYSILTGLITETALGNLKEYDKVRVNITGKAYISIFIDDKLVITNFKLNSGVTTVGIPNERNKGYAIQFKVSGVGALHNIEYSVRGRENA